MAAAQSTNTKVKLTVNSGVSITPKIGQLSQRERNRDNQRHTRARRRDNIQRLEAIVRQYERDGIRATTEVQLAARHVARENHLLRQLLYQQGVSDEGMKEYLSKRSMSLNPDLVSATTGSDSRGLHDVAHVPVHGRAARARSQCQVQDRYITDIRKASQLPTNEPRAQTSEELPAHLPLERHESPMSDHLAEKIYMNAFAAANDETDCTDAALIIASLRGGGAAEDVRRELGCRAADRCYVKNHMVFSLAD